MSRRSGCPTKKIGYPTSAQAYAAALRVSRLLGPVRAYLCPTCTRWHLTTQRKRVRT